MKKAGVPHLFQRFRSARHLYTGLEVGLESSSSHSLRLRPIFCYKHVSFRIQQSFKYHMQVRPNLLHHSAEN